MRRALELGASALELDIRSSSDGVPVCCHDPSLPCAAGGFRCVSGTAYEELGVTSLEDVLRSFPGVVINLDLKSDDPITGTEQAVADLLRRYGRGDDVIVTSFSDEKVERFSSIAPEVPTGAPSGACTHFVNQVRRSEAPSPLDHVALQLPTTMFGHVVIDRYLIEAAHELSLAVHAWTVNDPVEMERLVSLGVDGIMSDVPGVLFQLLHSLGVAWEDRRTGDPP